MMFNTLRKFLALHHHLALPGIGNFSVEKGPAQIDIANRIITPPFAHITFSNEKMPPEKTFFNFLAQDLNTDEVQALSAFTDFTAQLQLDIEKDKPISLKGIGTLRKQSPDGLLFQSESIPEYFPGLTAERVIRKNATHSVRVGEDERTSVEMHTALHNKEKIIREERWWIPAAILAVLGIIGIAYYYLVLHPVH